MHRLRALADLGIVEDRTGMRPRARDAVVFVIGLVIGALACALGDRWLL